MADVQLSSLGSVIKTAYEAETNTNAYTDAEKAKLAGIETGAQVNTVTSVNGSVGDVELTKTSVGLANVDNTTDANKPISTATQNALDLKAPLASPTFTGNPTAPTPTAGDNDTSISTTAFVQNAVANKLEAFTFAASDETTALTVGTGKITFRMPYAFIVTGVKANVNTAPTGASLLTVDINKDGTSILSTKLTFDATEKTTVTATVPAVISDTSLPADSEISIDIDQVGSTVAGAGLKVTVLGHQ